MFIVFPYSHEDMYVRKYPVWTISIIIICFLSFVALRVNVARVDGQIRKDLTELVQIYINNPDLEIKEELYREYPQLRQYIRNLDSSQYADFLRLYSEKEDETAKLQLKLNDISDRLIRLRKQSMLHKFGYIPADGFDVISMITSGFLHYGFFHLLGNMLILWLTGAVIEDKLGRIYFPVFYIMSIILSAVFHLQFTTGDMIYVPLIGASGGIAGLMGAFLIKMAKTKINLFYLIFFFSFKAGTFELPAYIILPFWFGLQLVQAIIHRQVPMSNIAFWAHVGGFLFGFCVYLFLKYSKIEEKHIESKLEEEEVVIDKDLVQALEHIEEGNKDLALPILEKLKRTSDDYMVWAEASKIYLEENNKNLAFKDANTAISLLLKKGLYDIILSFYTSLREINPDFIPEPKYALNIANSLKKMANEASLEEAKGLYKMLFKMDKSSQIAVKSVINYADILYKYEKNPAEAKNFLKKAAMHYQKNPNALSEIKIYYDSIVSE